MGRLFSLLKGVESSLRSRLGMWMQEVSLSGDQASSNISTLQTDVDAAEADISTLQVLEAQDAANIVALQAQNVLSDGTAEGQIVTYVGGTWTPTSPTLATGAQPDTLVSSDVGELPWRLTAPDLAPRSIQRIAGTDDNGMRSAWRFNRELNCPAGGYVERPFTVPTGVTEIEFGADVELPAGAAAQTVQLQIYDATGQTQVDSVDVTPTGVLTRGSTGTVAVTAGLEYRARITFTDSGQADVLLSGVRVEVVSGTGVFASSFLRIDAEKALRDNNERSWAASRYPSQSAYSHIDFRTTATSIVIEAYNSAGHYVNPPADSLAVLVDGEVYTTIDPAVDAVTHTTVTLPAGDKLVSVLAGPQVSASTYEPTPRGANLLAVYASDARSADPDTRDPIVIYGDSKTAGFYSDVPGRDGLIPILRRAGHRVISEAYGGRAFLIDTAGAITVASCTPFARKLTRSNPKTAIIAIGRNDFMAAYFSLANWTSQLGNLCDAIQDVSPRTKIVLVKFTSETAEPNNGSGDTMDQWRAAMDTVASTRTEFVSVVHAQALWPVADAGDYTSDGVHPNSRGYALLASAINGASLKVTGNSAEEGEPWPWSPIGLSNLYAWYEGSQGRTVTGMSATTSAGTGPPPAVTFTGAPNFPCTIDLAIRVGGARGVAEFAWSLDGGESWVEKDVLTAAAYVLGNTGVTANFAVGNYLNDNTYAAGALTSAWDDLSPNARQMTLATGVGFKVTRSPVNGKRAHLALTPNGTTDVMSRVMTLTPPFTILFVAAVTSTAAVRSLIGSDAGNAIFLYSNSSTTMAINDGTVQKTVTTVPTDLHVYTGVFSATGYIAIDGAPSATGDLSHHTPTTIYISDPANAWRWDGPIHEIVILDDADATAIAQCEAYLRDKYGR